MAYLVDSLVRVAEAGANLTVGENYLPESLIKIANAMKGRGGHLTIRSNNLLPDSMVKIALAAPGQVTFDVA
jgi:hypothetical protein